MKCKSLRTVTFPEVLDMYDFCTDKVRPSARPSVSFGIGRGDERRRPATRQSDSGKQADARPSLCSTTTTSTQMQQQLSRNRDKDVDEILGREKEGGKEGEKEKEGGTDAAVEMDVEGSEEDRAALQAALAMSMAESADAAVPPEPVGPGLPLDFSGNYELFGVVTHKVS